MGVEYRPAFRIASASVPSAISTGAAMKIPTAAPAPFAPTSSREGMRVAAVDCSSSIAVL